MNPISIYLAIAILSGLAVVLNLVVVYNKQNRGLSRLAGIAFVFVITGIFLGGQRWWSFALLAIGMILAIVDFIQNIKTKISH